MKTNSKFLALIAFTAVQFTATIASAGPALEQFFPASCRPQVTKENCIKQRLRVSQVLQSALSSIEAKVTGAASIHLIGQMGDGDSIMSRYLVMVPVKAESFATKVLFTVEVEETVRDDGDINPGKITVINTYVKSLKEVRL